MTDYNNEESTQVIGGQRLIDYEKSRKEMEDKLAEAEAKRIEAVKPVIEASEARLKANSDNERHSNRRNLIEDKEFQYYRDMDPEMIPEAPVPQSQDQVRDFDRFGICLKDGTFFSPKQRGGTTASYRISNFVFSILFQYRSEQTDCIRLLKYENNDTGECGTIEMSDREMLNFQEFRTLLAAKNCVFKGSPGDLAGALQRAYLYQVRADYIDHLGWNKEGEFFAFSNAVVTKDGQVSQAGRYGYLCQEKEGERKFLYLPQWAEANLQDGRYDEERRFLWEEESKMSITRYLKLLYEAYGMSGFAAGLYLMAAEMYDIIFDVTRFFPYLFLFGRAGTGKTTLINFLLAAYGRGITGTSVANSTMKGMARAFSQIANGLIYLKEYTNQIQPEVDSLLKVAYDGQTYRIAQNTGDNRTRSFSVSSGIVIDGNEMPSNQAAVMDRCIVLELEKTEFGESERLAMENLKKEVEGAGLSSLTVEATRIREDFGIFFKHMYPQAQRSIDKMFGGKLEARTLNHTAMLMATYKALQLCQLSDYETDDAQIGYIDEEEFGRWLAELCERKRKEMEEVEVTKLFLQAAADAIGGNWGDIADYYGVDRTAGLLYMNYPRFYKEYCKYCRETGQPVTASVTVRKLLIAEKAYYDTNEDRFYPESGKQHRQRGMVFRMTDDDGNWIVKGVQMPVGGVQQPASIPVTQKKKPEEIL